MSWTNYLSNPEAIASIYGEVPPSLERIRLHEVSLDFERGSLRLRFDLAGFPEQAPRKWLQSGYNTVQLDVQATWVRSISARGRILGEPLPCGMQIEEDSEGLLISLESELFAFNCQVERGLLVKISAYLDEVTFE